jgi:hypothetical protein
MQTTKVFAATLSSIALFTCLASGPVHAQATYKPGDRVECDWLQNGSYDSGILVPYTNTDLDTSSGRWFRVKLDKDKIPGSTVECMAARLRASPHTQSQPSVPSPVRSEPQRLATTATSARLPQSSPAAIPKTPQGQRQNIPGSAWKIDYGRGKTGDVFLFCSTGTWQIVPASGRIGAVGRSYRVSGNTLTTVNRDDGRTQNWRMSDSNGSLVINDGKQTLKLHYNGTTQCR